MALNWFVYLILPPINHSRIVYLLNIKTAHTFSLYAWKMWGTLFGNDKIILTSRKLVRFRCFGINSFQTNNYFVTKVVFHCPHSPWETIYINTFIESYIQKHRIYTFEKRALSPKRLASSQNNPHRPYPI